MFRNHIDAVVQIAVLQRIMITPRTWHAIWQFHGHKCHQTLKAMFSQVEKYLKVKREATRLMMAGKVDLYMRKLRELQSLRPSPGRGLAAG